MIQTLRNQKYLGIALSFIAISIFSFYFMSDLGFAQTPKDTACTTIEGLTGAQCSDVGGETGQTAVNNIAKTIVNILSAVAGAVAVIFLVIGGIRYATSNGSPDKVKSAKSTILAALIGFALVIATQFILNVAIGFTQEVVDSADSGGGDSATGTTGE